MSVGINVGINVGFFSKCAAGARKALTRKAYPSTLRWALCLWGIGSMKRFAKLLRDRKGATAIEYGLIVALIVIAMIAGLQLFAGTTVSMWNSVQQNVTTNG
jgi:pilus assembly protein Flp/PilA